MDERSFSESRKPLWEELSNTLDQVRARGVRSLSRAQLESLGAGYRAVVSDLAFARTQGASEELVLYLNNLAGRAHGVLYASGTARARGAVSFLLRDFPALFRATWRYTLAAALIFAIGWAVAVDLIYTVPEVRGALIPERLATSKPEKGDGHASGQNAAPKHSQGPEVPFLEAPDPARISSFIMTNNIREGIIAFAGGVTFGAVTVFTLFKNGLVIGAVLTVAFAGLNPTTLLSLLLPHGFIELVAIFICGGGGLMMGSALIAPGNLRRADSIRLASGRALRLFAGALPMFVVAAIIEGFITPAPIPPFAKLAFSGLTLLGLVAYLGFAGKLRAAPAT